MDITSLYYFRELTKDLHMTRTANRLFISQQTLSNHIIRMEESLGVKLFHRKPALSLTYAGEKVLRFADTVLAEQANLTDILAEVKQDDTGVINLGGSTLRLNACLPVILPFFTERYPHVELRIDDDITKNLEPMVTGGDLDMAMIASTSDDPNLIQTELMKDQIFLCIPHDLLVSCYGEDTAAALEEKSIHGADIADFSRLPFMLFNNRLGKQVQHCFDEAGFTPKPYITCSYMQLYLSIAFRGPAAFYSTRMALLSRHHEIPDSLNIFPLLLNGERMYQDLNLIRNRQRYLTKYSSYLIELMQQFFSTVQDTKIAQIAKKD